MESYEERMYAGSADRLLSVTVRVPKPRASTNVIHSCKMFVSCLTLSVFSLYRKGIVYVNGSLWKLTRVDQEQSVKYTLRHFSIGNLVFVFKIIAKCQAPNSLFLKYLLEL